MIRQYRPGDDRNAISNVYEESWKYTYRGMIPDAFLDGIPKGKWASGMDIPGRFSLLAIEEDHIVGTAAYGSSRFTEGKYEGELIAIYLLPEYMKKGYGKQLLKRVECELKNNGYQNIYLWVLDQNVRAIEFYEKNGYTATGINRLDHIGGKTITELQYKKCL